MARENIGIDESLLTEDNHVLIRQVLNTIPDVEDSDDYHEISNTEKAERVRAILEGQGKLNPESGITTRQIAFIVRYKEYYIRRNLRMSEEVGDQLSLELAFEA